jgi:hypothetical protein
MFLYNIAQYIIYLLKLPSIPECIRYYNFSCFKGGPVFFLHDCDDSYLPRGRE